MGGCYWCFSVACSQISIFVSVYLYNEYATDNEDKIDPAATWIGAGVLFAVWLTFTLHFMFNVCVPEMRHTFWSTATAWQSACDLFLDNDGQDDRRIGDFHVPAPQLGRADRR
jgi:hypothetical protein